MNRGNNMRVNGRYMPDLRNNRFINNQPQGQFFKRKTPYNNSYSFGCQPFSDEYWCETCDRGFRTNQILEDHKKQHQKCNIDGCQFIAHPKVIIKHVQMQHSTGLYKKIAKLNNPEEIEKWREERKKKYPTKSNIEKKNLEIKEKIERGEKMGAATKSRGKPEQMKQKRPFENRYSRKHEIKKKDISLKNTEKQFVPKKICKIISVSVESRKLKPFQGLQHIMIDESIDTEPVLKASTDLIEDDEFMMEDKPQISSTSEPTLCGALTSLVNNYGSSDEEDTGKDAKDQITNYLQTCNKSSIVQENKIKIDVIKNDVCKSNDIEEDDSGPEEVKVIKDPNTVCSETPVADIKMPTKQLCNRNTKEKVQSNKIVKNTFKRRIPSTLLEKLLNNEIRHERNIVLQCIRHIVKNKYFSKT